MLAIIMLLCFILVCGIVHRRRNRARQCLAHLPSYPQLPLIGSAHYFLGDGRQILLRLLEITEISEKRQLPFVIWMGTDPCLLLNDLDDIKAVTNEFVEKPYYYNFAKMWLGEGIFTAPAATWKHNIKKLSGTFTSVVVEGYQDVFNSQAQKLVAGLKNEVERPPFDVMEKYLSVITMEAICQIALGVPNISDSVVTKEYYRAFMKTIELIQIRAFNIFLHSEFLFGLSSYKKEMTKAVTKLHHVSETVMQIRQQSENHKDNHENKHSGNAKRKFKSYLDILLELNSKDLTFTMKQVKNEIDTIILAGQETVATSLFYILLMIGCHPQVQDKLYAEMHEIFGDSQREVSKEDLARMTYCEAVIYETLRLYPPAPVVIRIADHELQLKSCTVPKGAHCFVNIFGVGRSKKYWGGDANEFRPERFESTSVPPGLLAFSTGKRSCIGKKYTMSIMKTIVAYCVRELVFTCDAEEIVLKIDIALRTVCKNLLQVNLRQK